MMQWMLFRECISWVICVGSWTKVSADLHSLNNARSCGQIHSADSFVQKRVMLQPWKKIFLRTHRLTMKSRKFSEIEEKAKFLFISFDTIMFGAVGRYSRRRYVCGPDIFKISSWCCIIRMWMLWILLNIALECQKWVSRGNLDCCKCSRSCGADDAMEPYSLQASQFHRHLEWKRNVESLKIHREALKHSIE